MPLIELKRLWAKAPWTLQILVAVSLVTSVLLIAGSRPVLAGALVLVVLAEDYLLLKGFRWFWFLYTAYAAIWLIGLLLAARPVGAVEYLIALVLLLAPPTRRHFGRRAEAVHLPESVDRPAKGGAAVALRELPVWIVGFTVLAFALSAVLHPLIGFFVAVLVLGIAMKTKLSR
jgi:hypothetical protein